MGRPRGGSFAHAMRAARKAEHNAVERREQLLAAVHTALAPVAEMKGQLDDLALQEMADEGGLEEVFRCGYLAALCDVVEKLNDKVIVDEAVVGVWIDNLGKIKDIARSAYGRGEGGDG